MLPPVKKIVVNISHGNSNSKPQLHLQWLRDRKHLTLNKTIDVISAVNRSGSVLSSGVEFHVFAPYLCGFLPGSQISSNFPQEHARILDYLRFWAMPFLCKKLKLFPWKTETCMTKISISLLRFVDAAWILKNAPIATPVLRINLETILSKLPSQSFLTWTFTLETSWRAWPLYAMLLWPHRSADRRN